jgi:hypothetical protein
MTKYYCVLQAALMKCMHGNIYITAAGDVFNGARQLILYLEMRLK